MEVEIDSPPCQRITIFIRDSKPKIQSFVRLRRWSKRPKRDGSFDIAEHKIVVRQNRIGVERSHT